jgi:hypothetical protein
MKIALIVTLGARDLQLDLSYRVDPALKDIPIEVYPANSDPNNGALKNPRNHGNLLNVHYEKFEKYIRFPIVQPAIEYVLEGHCQIDKLVMVVTDQRDEKFNSKDTLSFGRILKKFVERHYKRQIRQTTEIVFKEHLLDYDYNYITAEQEIKRLIANEKQWYVFLLPQGGIDAINTAILLRCIERFECFSQLTKPEGQEGIVKQLFPNSFRSMLYKHRLIQSIDNFNYAAIDEGLTDDEYVITIANYAYFRLGLDYEKAWKIVHEFKVDIKDPGKTRFLEEIRKDVARTQGKHNIFNLQSDLYAFVKIRWRQAYFADFLMRLFALSEIILIPLIEESFKVKIVYNESDEHRKWKDFLNEQPDLLNFIKTQKVSGLIPHISYPNRNAYIAIHRYLIQNNRLEKEKSPGEEALLAMNVLALLRNKIAHGLSGISKEMIIKELENHRMTIDQLFSDLDNYFGFDTSNEFGVYSRINKGILEQVK